MEKRNLLQRMRRLPGDKALEAESTIQEKAFDASALRLAHWMKDSRRFSYLDTASEGGISTLWMYDIQNGQRHQVIPTRALTLPKGETQPAGDSDEGEPGNSDPGLLRIRGYQWSPDEQRILFARPPFPHAAISGDTSLFIYDLPGGKMQRIARHNLPHRNVKWSPDGKRVGYVRGDELYVLDVATRNEMRLTDSASATVFNGRFGWIYEEELELVDGWEWAPDGKRIAYYQYDETNVPVVPLTDYTNLHLEPRLTRYPKPGDPNPKIRIGLVDVPDVLPNSAPAVPPTRWTDLGPNPDILIVWMQWMTSGALLLHRMSRLQNRLDLLKVNPATGQSDILLTEEDKAWIEAWKASFDRGGGYKLAAHFVKGTGEFVWQSDRDGHTHLYLYSAQGKLIRQLTRGDWDVDERVGLDDAHRVAFFIAARPSPLERQIYSVLLDGGGEVMQVSDGAGTHQPIFAPDAQHFLDAYSSREKPPHTRLHRASGRKVADVPANSLPKLEEQHPGNWEYGSFKTSDGVRLNFAMLKPDDFDPKRKYPVLMYTYGGPGFQVVLDDWGGGSGMESFLSPRGIISFMVDGRGSGMRGREFMKMVYQNLGRWEVHDQIEAAKWLGSQTYIDPKRIGIWGASYGGYMACLCILRGAEAFKMAMAVAPVTHWSLYDSIYTERYMRRPKENPLGYESSSPITDAASLKGAFLLVHGTADDNVHFQNSAWLASALQKRNKAFQTMFYPGEDHNLAGVGRHLELLMRRFIIENL